MLFPVPGWWAGRSCHQALDIGGQVHRGENRDPPTAATVTAGAGGVRPGVCPHGSEAASRDSVRAACHRLPDALYEACSVLNAGTNFNARGPRIACLRGPLHCPRGPLSPGHATPMTQLSSWKFALDDVGRGQAAEARRPALWGPSEG